MIKILILGGSGILSLDVLKESLNRNIEVTCITRGNRDYRIPQGVKIIHGDIHNLGEILPKLDNHYDAILDFLTFNVEELKDKLNYLSYLCTQYIFVSSATAYSFQDEVITENTPLGNEYWSYGEQKVQCELFLKQNAKLYEVKYTIIRPYITYGKTRIPFAIIPDGQYWSLANRILNKKPILLWDDGKALCTLTNTKDFAHGFVDLIMNENAYDEDFHITSDEVLSWKQVLNEIGKALGEIPIVFSANTEDIINLLPEYRGILRGDKARNRIFDNSKIKRVAPSFQNYIPFSKGIVETIQNYESNPKEQSINYKWDGRIDRTINILKKSYRIKKQYKLSFAFKKGNFSLKNFLRYLWGKYPELFKMMKR